MNSVNKLPLWSQNTYLTARGSGDDSVHVSSVITPHYAAKMYEGRCSAITNVTCYPERALWRYDIPFLFTIQSEVDSGIVQYVYVCVCVCV